MGISVGQDMIQDGLVLALDAGDKNSYPGSGTTWFDVSGNNNGTLTNGPTFNSSNGGSIVFDGTDDYVNCGNNLNPISSFSCSAWINFTSTTLVGSDTAFLCKFNTSSTSRNFILGYRSSGAQKGISFYLWDSSFNQQDNYRTDWNPSTSIWYNVIGVFLASNFVKIYINGVEDYSRTTGVYSSLNSTSTENIISGYLPGFSYFPGRIASTQVYNRALSSTEILQNYNTQKTRFSLK